MATNVKTSGAGGVATKAPPKAKTKAKTKAKAKAKSKATPTGSKV